MCLINKSAAWLFELAGGAVADFDNTCIPLKQRQASWTIAAFHQWEMGEDDPRCVESAEEVRFSDLAHAAYDSSPM